MASMFRAPFSIPRWTRLWLSLESPTTVLGTGSNMVGSSALTSTESSASSWSDKSVTRSLNYPINGGVIVIIVIISTGLLCKEWLYGQAIYFIRSNKGLAFILSHWLTDYLFANNVHGIIRIYFGPSFTRNSMVSFRGLREKIQQTSTECLRNWWLRSFYWVQVHYKSNVVP